MTASQETGPVVLLYGCAECNWIYSPQTPEEITKTYLLMAQFKFEQHVCSTDAERILASAVPSHSPTTEELLRRAEDLMREDCAYLKDFNAAADAFQKRQAEFQTEHPAFGRYS